MLGLKVLFRNRLQVCQSVADLTLGLPSPSGETSKILSFLSNTAGGYGQNIGTAPAELLIDHSTQAYVPGKSSSPKNETRKHAHERT